MSRSFTPRPDVERCLPDTTLERVIESYLCALDCPRSLTVWLIWKYGDHADLKNLKVDPLNYSGSDVERYHRDYAATEFLLKADFLNLSVDIDAATMAKFNAAEASCLQTNVNLETWTSMGKHPLGVASAIESMRRKISNILGDTFPSEEFVDSGGWGPGANVGISRRDANGYNKFGLKPTVTKECFSFIKGWFPAAYPLWARSINWADENSVRFVDGNRLATVPKTAFIKRTILVEPSINLFLQKGVGGLIRRRLNRSGFSIRDQDRNRQLSQEAWPKGLATVDFSAASDTISAVLCERLLPEKWYSVMNAIRSHSGTGFGGAIRRWEKFSTMGNGFTFELETLIFLTLAMHVCDLHGLDYSNITVYGDDVILPTECLADYSGLAKDLGFQVNMEKTWSSGYFRESCGAHWFHGQDVKPIYLKSAPQTAKDLIKFLNALRHFSSRRMGGCGCDGSFRSAWVEVHKLVPSDLRNLYGPRHLGDSVIWENIEFVQPKSIIINGNWMGWAVPRLVHKQALEDKSGFPLLTLRIFELGSDKPERWDWDGIESSTARGNNIPRAGLGEFTIRHGRHRPVLKWRSPGPWI